MRLMAPASSIESVKALIANGADDIYIGGISEAFVYQTFNGRSKINKKGELVSPGWNELKEIINIVHSAGGQIHLLANTPFLFGRKKGNMDLLLNEFLKYVEKGISSGIDMLVLGDVAAIVLVRKYFPDIKISASSYIETQNISTIKWLESMNVKRAILSYQCTLEDIQLINKDSNIDIEVFGHGGCSFYVGTCNLFHEMGEQVSIGYPCRAMYEVYGIDSKPIRGRVLDSFKMCSICKLEQLYQYKVKSLKIVGRDLDYRYISQIIQVYRRALDYVNRGCELPIEDIIPIWWKKLWCDTGRFCRYGRRENNGHDISEKSNKGILSNQ